MSKFGGWPDGHLRRGNLQVGHMGGGGGEKYSVEYPIKC